MRNSPSFPTKFIFVLSALSGILVFLLISPVVSLIGTTSPAGIILAISSSEAVAAIVLTVYASALTALVAVFFGVPLGYLLGKYQFPGRSLIDSLIEIPLMIPHTVAGIALITIFGSAQLVGAAFNDYGIKLTNNVLGIVLTLVFVSATYTVKQVEEATKSLDPRLELVSRSLGASSTFTFLKVTLPSIWRSVVSGAILTWARASSEVGALFIMAYYPPVASILILNLYAGYGLRESISNGVVLSPGAVNVATFAIFINLAIFLLFKLVQRKSENRT